MVCKLCNESVERPEKIILSEVKESIIMSDVFVKLSEVKKGVIVTEDVYKNTIYPIVRKNTVLTDEHLNVLQLFAIQKIKVKPNTTSNPEQDTLEKVENDMAVKQVKKPTFQNQYEEAVQQVKKEFVKWQSGIKPDVAKMRSIIVPLLEQLKRPESELTFLTTVATKEEYIYHHSIAVGLLAHAIGEKMNLSAGETIQLGIAGTLIDCGMAKIPLTILNKKGRLTTKEYNEVKKHPVYSYQMINDSPLLRTEMKLAVLQHHERLDGSGYPRHEKRDYITLYAKILGTADVYHARTSERIYRSKESPYKILESFKDTYEAFDVEVINALYEVAGRLSIGTTVRLSNQDIGAVAYLHQAEPFRPVIKLKENGNIIDLTKMRSISIEEVLSF